jgi:Bacterial Ig domain/Bacterial cadherin-like domain
VKAHPLMFAAGLLLLASGACTQKNTAAGHRDSPPAVATQPIAVAQPIISASDPVQLTTQRMNMALRDGTLSPMWGFCATGSCSGTWAPGPTIVATAGNSLTITLTNSLPVPTSLVILGQLGGGLGAPAKMDSPPHLGQNNTTFPGNAPVNPPGGGNAFVPPAQAQRVRSFGTEVAAGATQSLTWNSLRPGTYLYETGTLPSLQAPMGLYGVLVVTQAAPTSSAPGTAYTGVSYDADATLLFSEVDPVQNAAVDAAAAAGTDVNRRFNDPACSTSAPCYPAAVNYTPTYFLINGVFFDKTAPQNSLFDVPGTFRSTGNLLVRLVNAGLRTHVPSFVGLPMAIVAEDGNLAPGLPKVQNEALLTAGKSFDALVTPGGSGAAYNAATYPVFDRALSLSTANRADGGMLGFLVVNHAAAVAAGAQAGDPGMLPAAVAPAAVADAFNVPFNTPIQNDVTRNDVAVSSVTLVSAPGHGTLTLNADGTFLYTPATGYSGLDGFTYAAGNGSTAAVLLTVAAQKGGASNRPLASADSYSSNVAQRLTVPRPGVLANDSDPNNFPLTAGNVSGSTCATTSLNADGSFSVTSTGPSCVFSYLATNSQGTASAPATVTVTFGAASNLSVTVADAASPAVPIADYRWTLQEDLTFKHDTSATPSVTTRTIGTSFHRSHMPVVATGCVGPVSCGSGQSTLDPATNQRVTVTDADALARQTTPDQVALDPSKRYYLSVLPGDAGSPPGHAMGGAEVTPLPGGGWAPVQITLQASPLVTAQLSIYVYEDNSPTNGQDEPAEPPLGGFNIVLFDPAGRTGDPAGQQTYDAFNMPLSNALLGRPGCPDDQNTRTNGNGGSTDGHLVGAVYTCPNDPNAGTPRANPTRYALAGQALIKNLTPARYDVIAHPGAKRAGETWWQVETLEGTPAQDAFTGVNEPTYFQEFGPPGPHVTIGFVNPDHVAAYAKANNLVGAHTITGRVTNQHMSRPSDVTLWDSGAFDLLGSTTCQVVLNSTTGDGAAIAAARCDKDGGFTLANVPAGDFEVDVFDQWLDQIIQAQAVTVAADTPALDMGSIPVLSWFTQHDQNIYQDLNGNGLYDDGEPGISNVPLTMRYRNGALSNQTLSDSLGNGILVELFPLFNWYVAEADTTRYKQTGVHITVDGGGAPDTNGAGANLWTSHYATGEPSDRVEKPGSLSYGVQGFISQRNRVDWGRTPYVPGENGGIVGTVVYSSTRAFDDQRFNIQTIWEPLVPRVTVNLYRKQTLDDGTDTLVLVDTTKTSSWDDYVNRVFGADGNQYLLGPDNQLRDPVTQALAPAAAYPPGKQVNLQCPGQQASDPFTNFTLGADDRQRCYDGWHNWNQVQAAPYDGRYVFPSPTYVDAHPLTAAQKAAGQTLVSLPPGNYVVETVTPPGYEIVKEEDKNILIGDAFVAPITQQFGSLTNIFILPDQATLGNTNPNNPNTGDPGFQSDPTTNLGVSDTTTLTEFPPCVGNLHRVPDYLSLYPGAQQVAPFAGMDRPLCDRKLVALNDQMQTSASFFVFTYVPVASNNTGIILDDATSEFNAAAPDFGEKASVPFVPVSIKDWSGLEIGRTYSDQWGAYNMMTPSSWLVNPPTPSGYGPNMLVTCMNDPGPIPDPSGALDPVTGKVRLVTDPAYNPAYSNFCYTNPFMPGQTTYLDTPVLPIASFAAGYNPADCAQADTTPLIKRVDSSAGFGPWLAGAGTLTITAAGDQQVLNPAYAGPFATAAANGLASQRTITRHYGFGADTGQVLIGNVDVTAGSSWSDGSITVNVPAGTPSGELSVVTAGGARSVDTVTVTIDRPNAPSPARVSAGGSIQAAIDAARPGDLILVDGGTYNELVVMWKPVRLQGVGAGAVIINAAKYPTSKLETWRPLINRLFSIDATTGNQIGTAQVDPLPTQEITGGAVLLEPSVLGSEEGAGITVLAKNLPAFQCSGGATSTFNRRVTDSNFRCHPSRIDGISVTGGDAGGGIYVNGWAHGLEISNNRVYGNAGAYNGGIRVGVPYLETESLPSGGTVGGRIAGLGYDINVKIHHNQVTKNGTVEAPAGQGGAGGGISICAGTDNYSIDHNFVCGNYSSSDGGGIGHLGFSQNGTIAYNQVLFNQSFQQTTSTHGGGIIVIGEPPVAGTLSLGTGDVTIDANLIRGNFAEGGQGGGIRLQQVNGADVTRSPQPPRWHRVAITNNMLVNNVAGWAGGGISMADTLRASIVNNTIVSNDSTGIAGVVLAGTVPLPAQTPGQAGVGRPGPSGLVSEQTSAALLAAIPNPLRAANAISQPATLANDVIYQNRSFYYSGDGRLCAGNSLSAVGGTCATLPAQTTTGQCVSGAAYWDLGVLGDASPTPGTQRLNPSFSILTSVAGYGGPGNRATAPGLKDQYCNGSRVMPELGSVTNPPTVFNLQVAATLDEGANYVNLRYGPLFVENPSTKETFGDYHIADSSAAAFGSGTASGAPNHDFDSQSRPQPAGGAFDIGADELAN